MTADLEGRHEPTGGAPWRETWGVDFAVADGSLGGYLEVTAWPAEGRTWCWAALVGAGRPLVTVVELDAPPMAGPGLDLRAEGLWADQVCETPLEHWTVGLEAFGVALDDPLDAFTGCRGERTALGLDLEWESTAGGSEPVAGGYELACDVHGEVLVGPERLVVAGGWGRRRHTWGPWSPPSPRAWGRDAAGRHWAAPAELPIGADGHPAAAPVAAPVADRARVVPRFHAPVALATGRLHRSLAAVVAADGDGDGDTDTDADADGWAWVERWSPGGAGGGRG